MARCITDQKHLRRNTHLCATTGGLASVMQIVKSKITAKGLFSSGLQNQTTPYNNVGPGIGLVFRQVFVDLWVVAGKVILWPGR